MVASAQVVETSVNVTLNSPPQNHTHPGDRASIMFNKHICTLLIGFTNLCFENAEDAGILTSNLKLVYREVKH